MARAWVYDRHHVDWEPGKELCKEHSTKTKKLAKASRHGRGGRWSVRGYDRLGESFEEIKNPETNKPFQTRKEADSRCAAVVQELEQGIWLSPEDRKLTFGEFGDKQMERLKRGNPGTYTRKEVHWRLHIKPVLGTKPLASMTVAALEDWLAGLPGAASTQKNTLRTCKSVLRPAVAQGLTPRLNDSGLKSVRPPRQTKKKIIPWEQERTEKVLVSLPDRFQALGECWAHLGMRQGEGFAVGPEDLDMKRHVVHCQWQIQLLSSGVLVFQPLKDREDREIPVPDRVTQAVARHDQDYGVRYVTLPVWEGATTAPVSEWRKMTRPLYFTDEAGQPLHRTNFNRSIWDPSLERAGVIAARARGAQNHRKPPGCGCHALRHYYARFCLEAGVAIESLSEFMGHSTPGYTLDTYGHLRPDHMANALGLLNLALAVPLP